MTTTRENMAHRKRCVETGIAHLCLWSLLLYVPVETYISWPGLLQPGHLAGYLVDVIAFVLLGYGGYRSLRARPASAIAPLCAAWGYCACNAWRAYFGRVHSRVRGLGVYTDENPVVEVSIGAAMVLAFIVLGLCLWIAHQDHNRRAVDKQN